MRTTAAQDAPDSEVTNFPRFFPGFSPLLPRLVPAFSPVFHQVFTGFPHPRRPPQRPRRRRSRFCCQDLRRISPLQFPEASEKNVSGMAVLRVKAHREQGGGAPPFPLQWKRSAGCCRDAPFFSIILYIDYKTRAATNACQPASRRFPGVGVSASLRLVGDFRCRRFAWPAQGGETAFRGRAFPNWRWGTRKKQSCTSPLLASIPPLSLFCVFLLQFGQ